ncbi:MAG: MerR family transcriptional regulator [Candidatus Nanopelagicales bacterium]
MLSSSEQSTNAGVSVATAAASVGLTPATLRTWDRRYGLSPSLRTEGQHRRYNTDDLTRLRFVARLVDEGYPPASAVQAALTRPIEQCAELLNQPAATSGSARESSATSQNVTLTTDPPLALRAGGGKSVRITDGTSEQRGMARAATALDGRAVRTIVESAIADRGALRAWEELVAPTLIAIGDQWSRTKAGVEVEHVASIAVQQAFDVEGLERLTGRPILLACAPDDEHVLALLALRAALADRGVEAITLGQQVPADALAAAVTRLRPRAVVLWASMRKHADLSVMTTLPSHRPAASVYLAGPGWVDALEHQDDLQSPPTLSSLPEAVEVLA